MEREWEVEFLISEVVRLWVTIQSSGINVVAQS